MHSFTADDWGRDGRPYKGVRVLFDARITGGRLGTIEVGGSMDYAEWVPLGSVLEQPSRADIVDLAVSLLAQRKPVPRRSASSTSRSTRAG